MNTEQLTARVREAYEAFDRHDGGPLLAALSEDIEWWDPLPDDYPIGGLFRGKQAVVEYFRQLSGIAEIRSFNVADIIAQDHTVVALIHLESTMRHNGQASPETQRMCGPSTTKVWLRGTASTPTPRESRRLTGLRASPALPDPVGQAAHALDLGGTVSPGLRNSWGSRKNPTPPGVPVVTMSPARKVTVLVIAANSSGTRLDIDPVRSSCLSSPLR